MSRQSGAPRELSWAWLAIAVAGAFIYIAEQKTAKKIREAGADYEEERKANQYQSERLTQLRGENQELRKWIDGLNFELDGPWEEDVVDAGETETPGSRKTALEEVDPESRRPSE